MKALFYSISTIIMLAMSVSLGYATNYYISQETGNDKRSLVEAQNPSTPWKSIEKVNSLANYLKPGDAILFRRGETFYGTLHIKSSGSSTSPIKIGAYGSGSKPVITSLKTINGWKSIGNGIYESNAAVDANIVQLLLINGKIHEMGRYPNSNKENEGYLTIDDVSGKDVIYNKQLGSYPNWNGGEVVIKKNQWIINTHKVESHSGNQIRYDGNISVYHAQKDYGFFIQNHIRTLDTYGEWYFNPKTRKMNVYFGNLNPSSLVVEVSTLDNLFKKDYRDENIIIESIKFVGSNESSIRLEGGKNIQIRDTDIDFSGGDGILSLSVLDLKIERNTINHSYNNSMYLRYGNDGAIIRDNEVRNTALVAGRTKNNDAAGIGIFVSGERILVQNNSVINSGFNGIQFNGNHIYVKNNYVDTFCQIKGDGGGIYTYGGSTYQRYSDRKIEDNIVVNSIGSKGGIPKKGVTYKPLAEGIFLDDNANNIEISGNTVGNIENNGLKMSNVNNIKVNNNTFFNSHSSITLGNSNLGEDTREVQIESNQFFAKTADQTSYSIKTYKNDLKLMGGFDRNYFFRPFGDEFSILSEYSNNGKREEAVDNLEQWREKFGKDKNSVSNTVDISTYTINKKIGSSLFSNSSFDQNVRGLSCNQCEESWEGNSKTNGGAMKISTSGSSSIKINLGSLKKDKTYMLKFNAYANKEGSIQAYLRYSGSPWERLSAMTTFEATTEVNNFEVLVSPYADANEVSLMIATDESNFTYWMDDLEFVEVEASFINPEDKIVFEYNPGKNSKTIALDGTYVNAKLEKFSGNVTIPPYGSLVLIRISKESEKTPEDVKTPEIKLAVKEDLSQITEGDKLTLISEISNLDNELEKVDFYCGLKLVGSCEEEPYMAVIENVPSGENYIWASVTDKNGNVNTSQEIEFTAKNKSVASAENTSTESSAGVYFNLNNNGTVGFNGQNFEELSSEFLLTSGSNLSVKKDGSDEELFQAARFNKELKFKFPVENGFYTVKTYHNELYFGKDGRTQRAGQRVFDISIEGEIVKKDLDLFLENNNKETILTFSNIEIKDGFLNLDLKASSNNSLISGIAIIPVNEVENRVENDVNGNSNSIYYNLGDNGTIAFKGQNFEELNGELLLTSGSNLSVNKGASDEELFQTARFNEELKFKIPVENGRYTVQTYHNELYFGENGRSQRAGQRVFDISIEGNTVKKDLDLYLENNNEETILTFSNIEIKDGFLNLDLEASSNNSLISGIAILPLSANDSNPVQMENPITMYLNTSYQDAVTFQDKIYVSGGQYVNSPNSKTYTNTNASNEKIFQSERYSSHLNFLIPVENGTYTIQTYHNELYFGKGGPAGRAGNRVFDILIEGNVVKDDFDIYRHSSNQQTILTFERIQIKDGVLNLQLIASVNNASISGLSIIQESKDVIQKSGTDHLYFLNAGGLTDEKLNGITYLSETGDEKYYNGGTGRYENTNADVEALFQTERYGKSLIYKIPVPNGDYTVFTMHNEKWFGYGGGTARAGQRVFDIALQGETLKRDFDLFVENNNNPTLLSFENISVTDGILTLEMNASENNASISGIAIIGSAAKDVTIAANLRRYKDSYNRGYKEMFNRGYKEMDVYTETVTADEIRIFPNPAKGRATLEINAEIGKGRVLIHNMSGQLVSHFDLDWIKTSSNEFNIPLDNLSQGVYLVSVSNEQTIINKQRLIVNP